MAPEEERLEMFVSLERARHGQRPPFSETALTLLRDGFWKGELFGRGIWLTEEGRFLLKALVSN